ncbi:helix-turn-helix transcriptional regulator [Tsuneonella sp. HG222]
MAQIWHLAERRLPAAVEPAYERLLAAMGSQTFGATLLDCIGRTTAGTRRLYLFETTPAAQAALHYVHCEPRIALLLPDYDRCYSRLDPIGQLYPAARLPGDLALQRIVPGDLAAGDFRRRFFDEPGIVERLSIVQRTDTGWRGFNVARHRDDGPFAEREIDCLAALARLALPMLAAGRRRLSASHALSADECERRFADRWPDLTRRERQVCARAAIGMSVEATAIDLGIAKTTVVTFRQRGYRRLGVTSPFELCSLVAH